MYSSFLGFSFFIYHFTFFFFFFEKDLQLEYIVAFLSKSMNFSSFQAKIREVHIGFVGFWMLSPQHLLPQAQSPLFSKVLFLLRPMIAIRLWYYEPFKLRYTFGLRDKLLICENFCSFIPQHLRVYHNFRVIPSIFTSFICSLELGEHMIYG